MRYPTIGFVALALFFSTLFAEPSPALPNLPKVLPLPHPPKNPVLVTKEPSSNPFLHARSQARRLRKYLVKIFKQTKKATFHGYSVAGNKIILDKNVIKQMQHKTRVIKHPDRIKSGQNTFSTQILVTRREVSAAAREYAGKGMSTAALNMAHNNRPGDNVFWGKQTEEASLFRVSDYFLSLFPSRNPTLKKQLPNGKYHVPKFGGIYSPRVFVFRDTGDANFRYLSPPVEVAFIASLPYNMCHHSPHHNSPGSRGGYVEGEKKKIRAILRIAALKGHTVVILSDFGCDEHHNHPKVLSRIFREVLLESEFKGIFQVVDFAIPATATTQLFLDFSRNLNGLVQ